MRTTTRIGFVLMGLSFLLTTGCALVRPHGKMSWVPPREAVLWAETSEPGAAGAEPFKGYVGFDDAAQGTLYLYDASAQRLIYTGWIEAKQSLRLYGDRAVLLPAGASTQPIATQPADLTRYTIANYPPGRHVQAYVMRFWQGMKG